METALSTTPPEDPNVRLSAMASFARHPSEGANPDDLGILVEEALLSIEDILSPTGILLPISKSGTFRNLFSCLVAWRDMLENACQVNDNSEQVRYIFGGIVHAGHTLLRILPSLETGLIPTDRHKILGERQPNDEDWIRSRLTQLKSELLIVQVRIPLWIQHRAEHCSIEGNSIVRE